MALLAFECLRYAASHDAARGQDGPDDADGKAHEDDEAVAAS